MTQLNDFQIKWAVIQVNENLTQKIKSQIKRVDSSASFSGKTIKSHAGNQEASQKRTAAILEVLKKNCRTGVAYTITDKQFGLSKNSFNGIAKFSNTLENFIIEVDGNFISTIPVTKLQIKQAIKF